MHENMELDHSVVQLENLQSHFLGLISRRMKDSGDDTLRVHKDADFTENPMERQDVEQSIKASSARKNHITASDLEIHI